MEYQKSDDRHGLRQRPDIIFHIPAEQSHAPVEKNNFAVWALKHNGSISAAKEDFVKLDYMCRILHYRLALFVNVNASKTHLDVYSGEFRARLHAFATPGIQGSSITHSYFVQGRLKEDLISL
jgi:hypothetical protein